MLLNAKQIVVSVNIIKFTIIALNEGKFKRVKKENALLFSPELTLKLQSY